MKILVADEFTDIVDSIFTNSCEPVKDAAAATNHRDIGTEMTPISSSTTTRCHTPIKSSSPARHNTPANRSGPLVGYANCIDISEIKEAQFDSVASKWSSREEEEEEISKSLRHFEMDVGRKSIEESRASTVLEDEERTKSCIR